MSRSAKKSNSRQMFEAVFEQQTRRFSAFDLLGLSSEAPFPSVTPSPQTSEVTSKSLENVESVVEPSAGTVNTGQDQQVVVDSQGLALRDDSQAQELAPDSHPLELGPYGNAQVSVPDDKKDLPQLNDLVFVSKPAGRALEEPVSDRSEGAKKPSLGKQKVHLRAQKGRKLRPDGLVLDQTVDPQVDQTVDGQSLGQTVWPSLGQTESLKNLTELGPYRQGQVQAWISQTILLAPLQWDVWQTLQNTEAGRRIISYRQIARETNSTIDGVRKAVRVIQKEGGILAKEIIRSAEEQGFRVVLNRDIAFRRGTLSEAKAILKRGLALGQTPDRVGQMLGPDGLRMYVCNNINIKQTDIAQLLRVAPPEWKIREQTLLQVADAFPEMTAIEFRLSLVYLIEQARNAKAPIRHPNAWVKAAFEKNRGPLVTEREIEARFEQHSSRHDAQRLPRVGGEDDKDLEFLRRYFACDPQVRAEIDRMAEEKAAPSLKVVSEDKRASVLEEARLEAAREFFGRKPEPVDT